MLEEIFDKLGLIKSSRNELLATNKTLVLAKKV
jgi:hypothetical protein